MRKRFVLLLLVLAALVQVAATFPQESEIPSFDGWLEVASGPLVGAIVAVLISWLVEYWPAYDSWQPR